MTMLLAAWTIDWSHYLTTTVWAAVAVVVFLVLIWLTRRGLNLLSKRKVLSEPLAVILQSVTRLVLLIFMLLVVLDLYGIPVAGIWGAVIATGAMVAIGFVAVWSVLSNVFCAMVLLLSRPFGVGDEIELMEPTSNQGLKAKVVDFNLIFTVVREIGGSAARDETISVPNNIFFQKIIRRRPTKDSQGLAFFMLRRRMVKGVREPSEADRDDESA